MYTEILYNAITNCAKAYDPKDPNAWGEKISYHLQAMQISDELERLGFRLEQFRFSLDENNSVLVNENGE